MRYRGVLLACICGLFGASATAHAGTYVGLDVFYWHYSDPQDVELQSGTARGRLGHAVNRYLALEGHVATGGWNSQRLDGVRTEVELDFVLALMARTNLPLGACCNAYALAGAAHGRTRADHRGVAMASSFAYGGGAEVQLAPRAYLAADWTAYLDATTYSFSGWSVGGRWLF